MNEVCVADLPRFVQKRAHDKGHAIAATGITEVGPSFGSGDSWWWDRPLIDGTRLDAREVASYFKQFGMDETLLTYGHSITPEQVMAAVAWRKKHPRWRAKAQ